MPRTPNPCGKTRPKDRPYEIWKGTVHGRPITYLVLKKYQLDDDKPGARWFCCVTDGVTEDLGDIYVHVIRSLCTLAVRDITPPGKPKCGTVTASALQGSLLARDHLGD